jgi:Ca-activated chloride channel family protein
VAADRQVRVYTIGFGSTEPVQMVCSQQQLGGDIFRSGFGGGGFSGGGGRFRRYLMLDETTLQGMADITGGAYYRAEDAGQLYDVFVNLPTEVILQKDRLEISVIFSLFGAVFASVAVALSLMWHRFP